MDTKWKNRLLLFAWFLLFTFGISGVVGTLFGNHGYMVEKNYFNSPFFNGHIEEFISYVNAFEVSYIPKEERIKSLTVSEEEIEQYRIEYGLQQTASDIENEYEQIIQEEKEQGNQEAVTQLENERDERIASLKDDEDIKEQILKEKRNRINEFYKELEGHRYNYTRYRNAFLYFLVNKETGETFTNLDAKNLQEAEGRIQGKDMLAVKSFPNNNQGYLTISGHPLMYNYEDLIDQSHPEFEGKIGVPNQSSSFITDAYKGYKNQQIIFWIYTISVFVALIISIIWEQKKKMIHQLVPESWRKFYQYIPIDVAIVIAFITGLFTLVLLFDHYFFAGYSTYIWGILEEIFYHLIGLAIFLALAIIQGFYLYNRVKDFNAFKKEWEKAWIVKFYNMLRGAFTNRKVGTQVLLIVTIIFAFGFGLMLSFVENEFMVLYLPAFVFIGIPLFLMIVRKMGYFNKILNYASSIAKGQYEPDLKVKGKSALASLAADLNTMKSGVKTSQKAQAKSERLKTELITNVSHDLRTPLTSILTYSELLKNSNLSEDEKQSYIEIIDRKSKRLKVLIDDLFEASKMASGNIELVKEKVDLVQLLQQALAEYNESIQQSTIHFRISVPEAPVYALVDGQKLWRVFENLIGNILKYSLDHSRAYVQLKEEHGHAVISFKNVSEYELSENVDELFERFKRGDESRHTEGSGLGLAIAKSIIDLHEGTMDIDTDGDLFKVMIKI